MITSTMLVILLVACLVVTFVAYPHRGQEVPQVAWLGEAMTRAAERLPTIAEEEDLAVGRRR